MKSNTYCFLLSANLIPKSNINFSSSKICKLSHAGQTVNNCFIIRRRPAIMTAAWAKLLFWAFQWNNLINATFWHVFGDCMSLDEENPSAVYSVVALRNKRHLRATPTCTTFCTKPPGANQDAKSAAAQRQMMLSKMQPSLCLRCDFLLWNAG